MLLSAKRLFLLTTTTARTSATRKLSSATGKEKDPYRWPQNANPTPYDILEIEKSQAYTKQRYYELVKIYHPDHAHHHPHHHFLLLPPSQGQLPASPTRRERFHLVVAAHAILSDRSRRRDYDLFGTGWSASSGTTAAARATAMATARSSGVFYNATWEDWERWYATREGHQGGQPGGGVWGEQQEVWMRNGFFVALVLLLAALGSLAEISYAWGAGNDAILLAGRQTTELGRDISRRRALGLDDDDTEGNAVGRDERVKRFLMLRDPVDARRFIGPSGQLLPPHLVPPALPPNPLPPPSPPPLHPARPGAGK